VRVWYASAGTHIRALSVANYEINNAAQTTDMAQLTPACQHLQDAVNGLQNTMPAPNAELTTEMQAALNDFGNAAHGCLAGVPSHDQGAIGQAAQSMTSGGKHLDAATVILARITNGG
jgi:aryl-alcohol dehydrogenase-like predicted oxidoreductase